MGLVRKEGDGRLHLQSELMGESLMDKSLIASSTTDKPLRLMPDVHVVKVGGQSITDRGRKALFPVLDEIIENRKDKKIIISTGGGSRSRHVYSIALDLGMPAGVLAKLGMAISDQNALMIALLLADWLSLAGSTLQACVVEASMPTAVTTTVLAIEFDAKPEFVTSVVFLSTLASPITLTPLIALVS